MADDHPIPAYPFMFDQSQWSNKYSPLAGKAIPFPAQYRGTPTDALGRPIQSYLDTQAQHDAWAQANPAPAMAPATTLNSTPTMDQMIAASRAGNPSPRTTTVDTGGFGGVQRYTAYDPKFPQQTQQPAAPAAAPQTNPYDMNQAYLDALANPGKVVTPGATVPQSPLPSNQSGVLNQFLANWNKGGQQTTGAGNYNNRGFFDALQGQV